MDTFQEIIDSIIEGLGRLQQAGVDLYTWEEGQAALRRFDEEVLWRKVEEGI